MSKIDSHKWKKWNKDVETWMLNKPFLYALVFAVFLTLINFMVTDPESSFTEYLYSFLFFYAVGIGSAYFFKYLLKKYPQ